MSIHLYGQEVNPETYRHHESRPAAEGRRAEAANIKLGSTLSRATRYPRAEFDFMLSNPPYGKSWNGDLDKIGGKKEMQDPRFVVDGGG